MPDANACLCVLVGGRVVLHTDAGCWQVSLLADRWFYGVWTLPLWNFLRVNVVMNISALCVMCCCVCVWRAAAACRLV
jgi:hypothetical protein